MKQQSLKTLRNKADSLLTPLIIQLNKRCLLCGNSTQVAHHFIKKSESNRLRYELDNLISLCNHCHLALHCHETLYTSKITALRGIDWLNSLLRKKQEYIKVDRFFYLSAIEKLTLKLKELER